MRCVTIVRYSINLNGVLSDPFQPTRGLRGGEPLLPYLFLFVADCLSHLLKKGEDGGAMTPFRVS